MGGFAEALNTIAARVPEAQLLIIMATDGIPVQKLVLRPDPNLEAIAAEYTGLGNLHELTVVTDRMTALLVGITPEYFLFAALGPGAVVGRARFALRLAGMSLQPEFV